MEKLFYLKKRDGTHDLLCPEDIFNQISFEVTYHRNLTIKPCEIIRLIRIDEFPSNLSDKLRFCMLKYFSNLFEKGKKDYDEEDLYSIFECYNITPEEEYRDQFLQSFLQSLHEKDKYRDWDKMKYKEFKNRKLFYPEIIRFLQKDFANYRATLKKE